MIQIMVRTVVKQKCINDPFKHIALLAKQINYVGFYIQTLPNFDYDTILISQKLYSSLLKHSVPNKNAYTHLIINEHNCCFLF